MLIDKIAYLSKFRMINPKWKIIFSLSSLIICICANSIVVSILILATMLILLLKVSKANPKDVLHLMILPLSFVVLGVIAIFIEYGYTNNAMLFDIRLGTIFIGVTKTSLFKGLGVLFKCISAVSCMYFLSLTTPMLELFSMLRKTPVPIYIIEIMELIYRYIFVLMDSVQKIYTAQASRQGYNNLKNSYYSTCSLISNIFLRSYHQANKTYTAMEARGYDNKINMLEIEYDKGMAFKRFSIVYISLLIPFAVIAHIFLI